MTSHEGPSHSACKVSTRRDEHNTLRRLAKKERASAPYTLRTRTNFGSHTSIDVQFAMGKQKKGRLQGWQTQILEGVLQAGIWCPGEVTVELLVEELRDRTAKQVRDWFSNIQRNVREGKQIEVKGRRAPDELKTTVIEGLLLLRLQSNGRNKKRSRKLN